MHCHNTLVPIGTNFQATIPVVIPENIYKAKSKEHLALIRRLKVNDSRDGQQFYKINRAKIEEAFGGIRSYIEINSMRNAFLHSLFNGTF